MAEATIPQWATETPEQRETYELIMWHDQGSEEVVRLIRAEYIGIKAWLAVRRGYYESQAEAQTALFEEAGIGE